MWRGFTELKPGTLARRARAVEGRSGVGPSCHPKGGVLAKHPVVLIAVKEELLHLREAGIALRSPIAKVLIMTKPEVLLPQVGIWPRERRVW